MHLFREAKLSLAIWSGAWGERLDLVHGLTLLVDASLSLLESLGTSWGCFNVVEELVYWLRSDWALERYQKLILLWLLSGFILVIKFQVVSCFVFYVRVIQVRADDLSSVIFRAEVECDRRWVHRNLISFICGVALILKENTVAWGSLGLNLHGDLLEANRLQVQVSVELNLRHLALIFSARVAVRVDLALRVVIWVAASIAVSLN